MYVFYGFAHFPALLQAKIPAQEVVGIPTSVNTIRTIPHKHAYRPTYSKPSPTETSSPEDSRRVVLNLQLLTPFRGSLRPLENTDNYIMLHSCGKITVMNWQ